VNLAGNPRDRRSGGPEAYEVGLTPIRNNGPDKDNCQIAGRQEATGETVVASRRAARAASILLPSKRMMLVASSSVRGCMRGIAPVWVRVSPPAARECMVVQAAMRRLAKQGGENEAARQHSSGALMQARVHSPAGGVGGANLPSVNDPEAARKENLPASGRLQPYSEI
jgi:hypothetical protein